MKYAGMASAVVVSALLLLVSEAANAQSRNSNAQISARTAAKAQCVQEGESRVPTVHTPGQVTMRKSAYADCMRRAGFRP
jgi:hypothetical protein